MAAPTAVRAHAPPRSLSPPALAPVPESVHRALATPGAPLPAAVGLGPDFAGVRVHTDASATDVGAEAYTVGRHVVFAPGRFAPASEGGRRLLRHELAHIAQQRGAPPARALVVGAAEHPAEREAEAAAAGHAPATPSREPHQVLR